MASGTTLDYEATTSYSVTVNVSDKKAADGTANTVVDDTIAVTINVTDVNEPPPAPAKPTVAQNATTPKTKLDVSWTAPDTTGKPDISGYDVQYKKSSDSDWTSHTFSSTGTSTTLTGLDKGTRYDVQVRAVNDEGDGAWSANGQGSTQAPNVNPAFSEDTATRSIAENTAAGTNVGAAITATDTEGDTLTYSLTGTDAASFTLDTATGQLKVKAGNIPDYEAKTSYSVTVGVSDKKDTDSNADTEVDDTIAVTINVTDVNEPPAAPSAPSVRVNSTTPTTKLDVSWTAPDMTGKPAITDYDVQYRLSGAANWTDASFRGTGTSTTLTGLTAGKSYDVQVRATNDEGDSAWSDSGTAITPRQCGRAQHRRELGGGRERGRGGDRHLEPGRPLADACPQRRGRLEVRDRRVDGPDHGRERHEPRLRIRHDRVQRRRDRQHDRRQHAGAEPQPRAERAG